MTMADDESDNEVYVKKRTRTKLWTSIKYKL